jgi:hypothetical protein
MLSIRLDDEREWWVSSAVFDRLFESALTHGDVAPELADWQMIAHANGGCSLIDAEEVTQGLFAAARREIALVADADLASADGTYKVSLGKLLALERGPT